MRVRRSDQGICSTLAIGGAFGLGLLLALCCSFKLALFLASFLLVALAISMLRC